MVCQTLTSTTSATSFAGEYRKCNPKSAGKFTAAMIREEELLRNQASLKCFHWQLW